jgi:hypothetical protein
MTSVLYIEVANFRTMMSLLSPREVIMLLDTMFSEFDDLVHKAGILKVPTESNQPSHTEPLHICVIKSDKKVTKSVTQRSLGTRFDYDMISGFVFRGKGFRCVSWLVSTHADTFQK